MRRTWLSRRAILLHLVTLVAIAGFLALGWWQLTRALSGNTLSWVYTVEWPFFAAYAVYMWWRLLREQSEPPAATAPPALHAGVQAGPAPPPPPAPGTGAPDAELSAHLERLAADEREMAAYNEYLAALGAGTADRRRRG